MADQSSARPVGFHEGELAVQRHAGVAGQAARLVGMLAPGELRGGFARFLAERTFAALTARDVHGRLWVSPLAGPPGFLEATGPTTLRVHTVPHAGDPLRELPTGQPIGMVVVEFATRRRVRVNGSLSAKIESEGGVSLTISPTHAVLEGCGGIVIKHRAIPDAAALEVRLRHEGVARRHHLRNPRRPGSRKLPYFQRIVIRREAGRFV